MIKKEEHHRADTIHYVKTLDAADFDEFQKEINKAIADCEYIANRIIFFDLELRFACISYFLPTRKTGRMMYTKMYLRELDSISSFLVMG